MCYRVKPEFRFPEGNIFRGAFGRNAMPCLSTQNNIESISTCPMVSPYKTGVYQVLYFFLVFTFVIVIEILSIYAQRMLGNDNPLSLSQPLHEFLHHYVFPRCKITSQDVFTSLPNQPKIKRQIMHTANLCCQ